MDTYRLINRELSLHNQELRNALKKLKHEVTYLNEQLLEQREQFSRMKESIASVLENKFKETMALIYPERIDRTKFSSLDVDSHRRSNHNVTCADLLRNQVYSPNVNPTNKEAQPESTEKISSPVKTLENSLNYSDAEDSLKQDEENNNSLNSNASLLLLYHSICTIKEEASLSDLATPSSLNHSIRTLSDLRNETVSDATINDILEAPFSTPYNPYKNGTDEIIKTILSRQVRVLIPKMSAEKIEHLNVSTTKKSFQDIPEKKIKEVSCKKNRSTKRSKGASKENVNPNEDEITYSDDESNSTINPAGKMLRPKRKTVCLKEPSLRQKLRNTTNLKIR